jgi:hypothetical protein
MEGNEKARRGYSRDHRPDCLRVVIALVLTPNGFPPAYEVMHGNTTEQKRLAPFLDRIENNHRKAKRVWVKDCGIPTEATLRKMWEPERVTCYLVGTPKGRMQQHEKNWLELPWQKVRDAVEVNLYEHEGELYVLARGKGRQAKENAMRRSLPARDALLLRIGAAKKEAGRALGFVEITFPTAEQALTRADFTSG